MLILLWLILLGKTLALDDSGVCMKDQRILEIAGDAILTVFLDVNFGPYCNESEPRAYDEVTSVFNVVSILNKNHYISNLSIGLTIIDTCQDPTSVYKRSLLLAANVNCINQNYSLGILASNTYIPVLQPLQEFTDLSVTYFFNENITKPLINIIVDFVAKRFQSIDLFLTDTDRTLELFVNQTKNARLCVKNLNNITKLHDDEKMLIVIVAHEEYIRSWIDQGQIGMKKNKTWIILPLEDADIHDTLPVGSYLISSNTPLHEDKNLQNDDLNTTEVDTIHAASLLSIGKALIPIVDLLKKLHMENCQTEPCVLPHFDSKLLQSVTNTEIFDALDIANEQRRIKYTIFKKIGQQIDDYKTIIDYEVDISSYAVMTNNTEKKINLCVKKGLDYCKNCVNLWKLNELKINTTTETHLVIREKTYLKSSLWVLVFLILIACGTTVCFAVGAYIMYRFIVDDMLDGNPTLTFLLMFGVILLLHAVIPFCLDERIFGLESLNSCKIYITTLSIGFVMSIMVSRSLFVALSTGGVFSSHINGYLQGLMVLFTFGIQFAMSTMYLCVSPANSADILRSSTFVALLSYDILLLLTLLGVSVFIRDNPRNYHEGKCFFFTVISLMGVWFVWITIFLSIGPNWRDIIISAGLITNAYVIIVGIMLSRIYYMVTHNDGDEKDFTSSPRRVEAMDSTVDTRRATCRRLPRKPFYDYVLPMEGVRNSSSSSSRNNTREESNSNFYGNTSPSNRRQQSPKNTHNDTKTTTGFNNYGYHHDMQETANHYVVPRLCIDNSEDKRKVSGKLKDPNYAQPAYYAPGLNEPVYRDDCVETEIYVENRRLSPSRIGPNETYPSRCSSPRLYCSEATIDEEDEEMGEQTCKITRF